MQAALLSAALLVEQRAPVRQPEPAGLGFAPSAIVLKALFSHQVGVVLVWPRRLGYAGSVLAAVAQIAQETSHLA